MSATIEAVNGVSSDSPQLLNGMNHLSLNGNQQHTETEMQNLEQILYVSTTVLGQAIDLLENSLVSDEQLTVQSKYLPGSTIGVYCSHTLYTFLQLLRIPHARL